MDDASGVKAQLIEAIKADDANAVNALLESVGDRSALVIEGKVREFIWGAWVETPLLAYAILNGHAAVIDVLWRWGAPHRDRAVYMAAKGGTAQVMRAVLDAGADANQRLFCEGSQSLNGDLTAQELAEMWSVRTPLSEAVTRDDSPDFNARVYPATKPEDQAGVVALLLERGAEPDVLLDISGNRPLFDAIDWRNSEIVELLLRAGASANALPGTTWTPLMVVAHQGYAEGARLLLRYGADPSKRDSKGRTALDVARLCKHDEVAEVLAEHSK